MTWLKDRIVEFAVLAAVILIVAELMFAAAGMRINWWRVIGG